MEVKNRSWETREKVTALVQVVNAGVVTEEVSSGGFWVYLTVEQIDWKWDVREKRKSKPVASVPGRMETLEAGAVLEVKSFGLIHI